MMDADEHDIYRYIKSCPGKFVPIQEICRRVGGRRRFRYARDWARPVVHRMTDRGILESDGSGGYRLKPMPKPVMEGKCWASGSIAELLKKSGKNFDNVVTAMSEDDYYQSL
jgi:hypothetical protein